MKFSLLVRAFAVAVVAWFLSATAAAFSIDVVGPEQSEPDRLIVLEAKGDGPTAWKWIPQTGTAKFLRFENRSKLAFVPPQAGEYSILLVGAGTDETGRVAIVTATHTVSVSGEVAPLPDPDPIPDPNPGPDPVPSVFGLEKFARDKLTLIDVSSRAKAEAVAGVFLSSCGKAVATESTVAKLNASIAAGNVAALGDDREAWEPFFEAMNVELARLARSGRLVNLEQHVAAYREVAAGLKSK